MCWEHAEQQSAFDSLKGILANTDTLVYFDSNAEETKLITDASPVGLGAVTQVQGGCEGVIAYASRSLTDIERRKKHFVSSGVVIGFICTYME